MTSGLKIADGDVNRIRVKLLHMMAWTRKTGSGMLKRILNETIYKKTQG